MNVLLLRLAGPMQSWGVQSRFSIRDTGLEPSKSGIIGLLCAALGRPRSTPLDDLAGLRMAIRVDREGRHAYDFHTAQNVLKAGGGIKDTEPSRRYYLADARFLVALTGEDLDLLRRLRQALRTPVWPLYLGRKAFVPSEPVLLPASLIKLADALEIFATYPRLVEPRKGEEESKLRVVLEDENGVEVRPDQPISFAERRFAPRRVKTLFLDDPPYLGPVDMQLPGDHDDAILLDTLSKLVADRMS